MNDFQLDNNLKLEEMIPKLKNSKKHKHKQRYNDNDLFNIVKDLENRLDEIEIKNISFDDEESIQIINTPNKIKNNIKNIGINKKFNYQDFFIYIILFIILNLSFTIEKIYMIPHLKSLNNPYPNLIIRTIIFTLLIYLYKITSTSIY